GYGERVSAINAPGVLGSPLVKAGAAETAADGLGGVQAREYSTTNVQVEGVDEADIVKNDGKYVYVVKQPRYASRKCFGLFNCGSETTNGEIVVLQAFPPSEAKVVSKISVDGVVSEILVFGDKLVAFGSRDAKRFPPLPVIKEFPPETQSKITAGSIAPEIYPPYYYESVAFLDVFDLADKTQPKRVKNIELKGNYVNSRMIDGRVYAVFNENFHPKYPVPFYAVDGVARVFAPSEISYFDWPCYYYNFQVFLAIDLKDLAKAEQRKVILAGGTQNLYASRNAFYLTDTRYDYYYPTWRAFEKVYWNYLPKEVKQKIEAVDASDFPEWAKDRIKSALASRAVYEDVNVSEAQRDELQHKLYEELEKARLQWENGGYGEKTVINKIALAPDGGFVFAASGEVPGYVLNQFSMDEDAAGFFRIATTQGQSSRMQTTTSSNVFVLDDALRVTGRLTGIAPGESIYSARFMGKRLYLVTFKKVDPFFVIDLSDARNPKILGKLKIPGYSDYLHPYDDNHVIGLGKSAVPAEESEGDFAWYQGVKLSLFDVSDLANPKEVAKFEIGDRGTDSFALHDHKAFLFSKTKNLLVIPVLLAEIDERKYPLGVPPHTYGDYVFQGAYVFSVSPESGFVLRGRVTHADADELLKSGEYYYSQAQVKRSLYMDNYLYTVSDEFVKANDLASSALREVASVKIS
ncbi:MAG: beta-propeller domain-containing protein, partial [Candidatus Norongarragalinales archaeon]